MIIHVTAHAIQRYQERIANLSDDEVISLLSSRAIQAASDFGCRYVRIAGNHRIVLANGAVVTVLPADHFKRQVLRKGLGRYGKGEHHAR